MRFHKPDLTLSGTSSAPLRDTMIVAGEPGDRWLGHRKMVKREESPDTIVVGSREPVTKGQRA